MKNNNTISTTAFVQTVDRKKVNYKKVNAFAANLFKRIKSQDIIYVVRQLATLIQMRFPVDHSLEVLISQTQQIQVKEILADCKRRIEKGESIADAFKAQSKAFPETVIKFAAVGEMTGRLGEMLDQAATQLEKVAKLKRKLLSALSYPAVVLCVAGGAVGFLLTVVVPTFTDVFADFGGEMPAATRVLLSISDLLSSQWYVILFIVVVIVFTFRYLWKNSKSRLILEKIAWKDPVIGGLVQKEAIARFTRTLAMLLDNGIIVTSALQTAGNTTSSLWVREAVTSMNERIVSGVAISKAMQEWALFPTMLVQMVRVGEETGSLPAMLAKTADYYESEIDVAIDTLNAVVEPIIMVGLGLVIGAILIALYLQIFSVVDVIQ